MYRGHVARIFMVLVLLLSASGALFAQAYGRVTLVVKDEEGNLAQGVKVTVTTPEITNFRQERSTNKKGKAVFSFTDATKRYVFRIEAEGYQPIEQVIRPQIQDTITREVTLSQEQHVETNPDGGRVVYTPAEKVFNEGVKALQADDLQTAETNFLAALAKNENMALAHSALAGLYVEIEQPEKALSHADRLLQLEPGNPRAYRARYEAYSAMGNEEKADAALKELAKLDKGGDTVKIVFNEGVSAVKVGDYKEAKARFNEALQLDPNLKEALSALAVIYIKDGSMQEAAEMAERHLALVPNHPQSLQIRYDAYRVLGNTEKAEEAFQALAAVNPAAVAEQFFKKGVELFEGGDSAQAVTHFERAVELDPSHARSHYYMGLSLVGMEKNAEAKEHLQKFVDLAPNDPEAPAAKDMLSYLN